MYSKITFNGYDHKYRIGQLVEYTFEVFGSYIALQAIIETNESVLDNIPVYDLDNGLRIYEFQIIRSID
jgi:hypothetical protein